LWRAFPSGLASWRFVSAPCGRQAGQAQPLEGETIESTSARARTRNTVDTEHRQGISRIVHEALVSVGVPKDDRFQVISEHDAANFVFDPNYLDIRRTEDLVIIQITWNEGRTVEQKKALYKAIADGLAGNLGLRREDVFIGLIEVRGKTGRSAMGLRNTRELLANAITPARAVRFDIEMHVVGVERVSAGTQNSREPAASGRPHGAKVRGFVCARLPLDEEAPFVREGDRHEVHRQPMAMGADLGASDPVLGPAIVARAGFDCGDFRVQHRLAERRNDEADIVGEHGGEFAIDKRAVGQADYIAACDRDR
jgi:4-oxalocrotonate tautomerase